jgi:hypothetical protein
MYEEIKTGTEKTLLTGIAELFQLGYPDNSNLVDHTRGNWDFVFLDLQILYERLEELDIENFISW